MSQILSWHVANSTPPDPPWSWTVPHMAHVTKIGPEKAYFCETLTLTFDLWPWFWKNQHAIPKTDHHAENHVCRSNGCGRRGCDAHNDGRMDGRKVRKYIRICQVWSQKFSHLGYTAYRITYKSSLPHVNCTSNCTGTMGLFWTWNGIIYSVRFKG